MKISLCALFALIAIAGCGKETSQSLHPENSLTAEERVKHKLPAKGVLTLANQEDIAFVEKLDPDVVKEVKKFLSGSAKNVSISAARPVGDYLLLWIGFEELVDGGIDLIWSVSEKKSVGTFLGGYRG